MAVRTNDNFIFTGCYDGFIYVHRKSDGKLAGKIQGPGKMLLDFTLINNKVRKAIDSPLQTLSLI